MRRLRSIPTCISDLNMVTFVTRNLLNLYLLSRSKLTVNTYLPTFVVGFGTGRTSEAPGNLNLFTEIRVSAWWSYV